MAGAGCPARDGDRPLDDRRRRRASVHQRPFEKFALEHELAPQPHLQPLEQLTVHVKLGTPHPGIDPGQLLELLGRDRLQPRPVQILEARHPPQCRLPGAAAALYPIGHPFQDPHAFAESGPQEVALLDQFTQKMRGGLSTMWPMRSRRLKQSPMW